jgi:hypothetical protein
MSFLFPTSPVPLDAVDAPWMHQPITYLAVAAVCLVIALRFLKRALSPIGVLIQAVAAAAVAAFAAVLALALLIFAAFTIVP